MKDMIKRKQFPQFLAPYCIAFEKSVGAVVFRRVHGEMQFLLLKYRNGHWEFPRGKNEFGETEIATMYREIREETGLTKLTVQEGFRSTMRFSYFARGKERKERMADKSCIYIHKKAIFYLAEAMESGVSVSHEHQKYVWLGFDAAMQRLTYQNAKNILQDVKRYFDTRL